MNFDVRPFWLIGALASSTCGLLVLAVRKIYPADLRRVLTLLGIANICIGANYILRLTVPKEHQLFFNVLPNILITICLSMEVWAIRDLKHQRTRLALIVGAPLAMFVSGLWFTFAQHNVSIQNITLNLIDLSLMIALSWSMSRPENGVRPFPDMISSAVYFFLACCATGVIANYFYDRQFTPEYNFSTARSIFNNATANLAETIMIPLFLLMISDRLTRNLAVQAMRDPLTHLFNRRAFEEIAFREISGAVRANSGVALLMIDLDQFKQINDQYGHTAGDEVLITAAATLRDSLRDEDFLCRWGGDEFLALLPRARRDQAQNVAERILQSFDALNFTIAGKPVDLAVSIGAVTNETGAVDLGALIALADSALYEAKNTGRRRFAFAPKYLPALNPTHAHSRA